MEILGKIMLFLALLIMPVGIFLVAQGGYFYSITSKQSVSTLMDSVISDLFQSQITQLKPYCQMMNISCSNFSETREQICEKSGELRVSADNVARAECSNVGLACTNMETATTGFCNLKGNDSSQCIQLKSSTNQLIQYESICSQMDGIAANITSAKNTMYEQELVAKPFALSLAKINASFANSILIGIALILIAAAMVYAASKNIFSVAKCFGTSLLTMGIFCAAFGAFGYPIINGILPSGISMPSSIESFITGIFSFEFNSGIAMAAIGIIIFAAAFFMGKKMPDKSDESDNNEKAAKKKAKK